MEEILSLVYFVTVCLLPLHEELSYFGFINFSLRTRRDIFILLLYVTVNMSMERLSFVNGHS